MFEAIGDLLSTVLTGGATGLLGTLLSSGIALLTSRQRHRQQIELRRLDIELMQAEAAAAERVAAIEAEGLRDQAAWEALEASYREAGKRWSRAGDHWAIMLVDVVRGLMRPWLTASLTLLTALIYFSLPEHGTAAAATRAQIVNTVLYLETAAILWWFGQRVVDKAVAAWGGAGR